MKYGALTLLASLLAAGCASKGGGQDGTDRGGLISGGSAGNAIIDVPLTLASLPLEAINLAADWERVQEQYPLPWIAPGKRVAAYTKGRIPTAFDLDSERYRWRVGEELIYPFHKYNGRISNFIVGDPISRNWEFSGERVGRDDGGWLPKPELMPDYEFYLVSIRPMAVVMVPTGIHRRAKYLPNKRQKLTDWGAISDKSIHYSTDFPAPQRGALMWFSPDLKVAPQHAPFSEQGAFTIKVGSAAQITCRRTDQQVQCEREGAGG